MTTLPLEASLEVQTLVMSCKKGDGTLLPCPTEVICLRSKRYVNTIA